MPDTRGPGHAPGRYEAGAYDHGFLRLWTARRFTSFDDAIEHARTSPRGRVTSFTGRNVEDVSWFVRDTETGALHPAFEDPSCSGYLLDETDAA